MNMVAEVVMNEEVLRIQKMVAEGKITPEESVELLESVQIKQTGFESGKAEGRRRVENPIPNTPGTPELKPAQPTTISAAIAKRIAAPAEPPSQSQVELMSKRFYLVFKLMFAVVGGVIAVEGSNNIIAHADRLGEYAPGLIALSIIVGGLLVAISAYWTLADLKPGKNRENQEAVPPGETPTTISEAIAKRIVESSQPPTERQLEFASQEKYLDTGLYMVLGGALIAVVGIYQASTHADQLGGYAPILGLAAIAGGSAVGGTAAFWTLVVRGRKAKQSEAEPAHSDSVRTKE